jgi:hypothetical protein
MRAPGLLPVLIATAAFLAVANAVWSASLTLEARTSDADGVRVVVQPQTNAPVGGKWEFKVSMDTHVTPLSADLAKTSVLIDDIGHRLTPIAWQGDPPGGHHRKGVLQFLFDGASPKSVELQIKGIGGGQTRIFQWQLG